MSLLKEIHANAAVAWSPVRRRAELLALGSKGDGGSFENTGGEFKLMSMDFSNPSTNMLTLGSIKTPSRFTSLAWRDVVKHHDACPYGVVAGGMADGAVTLWNPKAMIDRDESEAGVASAEIGRVTRHKGSVNALQFNPHDDSSHLLATGGSDGEVYIMSLDKLQNPAVFTPSGASLAQAQQQVNEITSVAWNTQVNYIIATGSQNGSVMIWDLKQKKPWCELRDPQRGMISAIAWNPNEGLHIATASGDDHRPVIKLWDLRHSTSTPIAEFHDHSAGVLSLSWCPDDPGLLMSCAKDNRTLVWDLYTRKVMYEFPTERSHAPAMGSDQFFGGGAGQRRWNVQWAPKIPAVASTCTMDGKVQVWGLSGGGNPEVRPPKWARRPAGATFGFGGKLVTIANPQEPAAPNTDCRRLIHVHRFATEHALIAEAEDLDRSLESKDFKAHCERKIATAANENERSVWNFMKILFEKDARQHLLLHLGLDAEKINQLNAKFNPEPVAAAAAPLQTEDLLNQRIDGPGAEDVFSSDYQLNQSSDASPLDSLASVGASLPKPPSIEDNSPRIPVTPTPLYTEQSESTLMQALLVGNFEVAVNTCLHYNQFADALLLASCGGPELWEKTQRAFFAHQTRPVMKVASAIIKNELHGLVEQSDLNDWRQTLAILSTYAKSEEFPALCDKLASRLELTGDLHSATLCYMCAVNVEKTVLAWVKESEVEAKARGAKLALQRLVEKVSIFAQAIDQPDQSIGPEVASRFAEYSSLMAAQGRLDIAAKYARFADVSCAILRDRIYNAAPVPGYQPPPFPFDVVNVVAATAQQAQQGYSKQAAYGGAAAQYGGATQAAAQYGGAQAGYGGAAQHAAASGYGAVTQPNAGYGAPQQPAANVYGATPAAGGYGATPAAPSYAQPAPRGATPGYGRPQQPGYGTPAPQPAGFGAPPHQPGFANGQTGYGQPPAQPAYPGHTQPPAPAQNAFGAAQPSYQPQQPGAGFAQPRPQAYPSQPTPGYSGPPSTGSAAMGYGGYNASPANVPAIPQSTGVNPLTAQTSLASSRIAKPSVDMASQRKDGFVSSVGNKELTDKYGNHTTAMHSPMAATQPSKFDSAVPGSTEHVSAQDMPIVHAFNDLVAQLSSLPLTMLEQKQMSEILKSKEVMFTKLNVGDLSPAVVGKLHEMVGYFAQRDFASAQTIHAALTGTDWAQHKDWLKGLKSLIHISLKRFR